MKFYKISLIFLFLLIISMGAACAEDANQTAPDALETTDNNVLCDTDGTYTDLQNQINATSANTIELERNYTYNSQYDVEKYVEIKDRNLTIEGNHNYVDAKGSAGFLKIRFGSNVTIQNLLVKNSNTSALIVLGANVKLVNVTFENNFDASEGSAIYAYRSEVYTDNCIFKSYVPVIKAMIYGIDSTIDVYTTTFANTTSRYATAIYNNYRTVIKKSRFINLHADLTAGALAVKPSSHNTTTTITDSEFINVSSAKNGGALYLDIYGDADGDLTGWVTINNTVFENCSSDFGGAILQLGGYSKILNSQFINNNANENGGAIYTSCVELLIDSTNFTANKADEANGLGGALFFDIDSLTVTKSNFTDNRASQGGAVYAYNSHYSISDSRFSENAEDILTYFDKPNSIVVNCGEYESTLNASKSEFIARYSGIPVILNPTVITDASASDSSFDLRKYGLVTPVKNQGSNGACWAFGAAGAFESAFLKATGQTIDLSENNIQNMGLRYSIYGSSRSTEAGTYFTSAAYFLSWLGAVNSSDDVYDELGKISAMSFSPNAYHAVDAVFVDIGDRNAVKEALIKYGALNLYVYGANSQDSSYDDYYKSVYNSNKSGNHYVTLIGWNDTFSKDHYSITAPGDGAWICKNSWGTGWGDEGYFYLSYYDHALNDSSAVGFVFENTDNYDKLYQIEAGGYDQYNHNFIEYEDVFISDGGNVIAAVGTFFEKANTAYTISIYVSDNLVYTQSGSVSRAGYNTIRLDKCIGVENNTVFSVRVRSSSTPILTDTRQQLLTNNSYVMVDGRLSYLSDSVASIKVYAYNTFLITRNIVKVNDGGDVIFTVEEADDNVVIGFNGKNSTVTISDRRGSVNLGALPVGEYDVMVYYKNQSFMNHISVKSSINTGGVTSVTIGYNTKLTLATTFLDLDAKPLANTELGIKFDGESVKGLKTGNDGSLDIIIYDGNEIGTHYLDISNPATGESLRVTVTIVSRLTGNSNIDMYYFDGHSYKVRIRDNFGNFAGKNEIVTIKIAKSTFKVKTDANGYATLRIPDTFTPGKYTVYATYFGQTVKNTLKVKQVIKLTKVKVKRSAKKLVLKATLKEGSKVLKSKKVTFRFNGKKFSAKTDKKGVAKVTVKKSVLKKLKVGKKVTYQVTYLKDTVKVSVKVKR